MSPRPILKHFRRSSKFELPPQHQLSPPLSHLPFASSSNVLFSPHVHFPLTPSLITSTHIAHSPDAYDRKPIAVLPNCCSIPDRNSRVYQQQQQDSSRPKFKLCAGTPRLNRPRSQPGSKMAPKGSYFHPRAFEACETEELDSDVFLSSSSDEEDDRQPRRFSGISPPTSPPGLSFSSSSSSSDSDFSPLPPMIPPVALRLPSSSLKKSTKEKNERDEETFTQPSPLPRSRSQAELDAALSFLPHPASTKDHAKDGVDGRGRHLNRSSPPKRPRSTNRAVRASVSSSRRPDFGQFSPPSLDEDCLGGF